MKSVDKYSRQDANLVLAEILNTLVHQYPDLRFGQILQNFGFVDVIEIGKIDMNWNGNVWADEFYKESEVILKRVQETIIKIREQS